MRRIAAILAALAARYVADAGNRSFADTFTVTR